MEHYKNLDLADIKYFCEIDQIEKTEQWKDVVGYEELYQVSSLGRIKSVNKISNNRHCLINIKSKILSPAISSSKYFSFGFSKNKKSKTFMIHRLVAIAFIPNPENKLEVNHKDGDKINNILTNLEWNTKAENQKHAYKNNLQPSRDGIKNGRCVLDESTVIAIRRLHNMNPKINLTGISRKLNMSQSAISSIVLRKTWKHI